MAIVVADKAISELLIAFIKGVNGAETPIVA
jgi:hypothetical protein